MGRHMRGWRATGHHLDEIEVGDREGTEGTSVHFTIINDHHVTVAEIDLVQKQVRDLRNWLTRWLREN